MGWKGEVGFWSVVRPVWSGWDAEGGLGGGGWWAGYLWQGWAYWGVEWWGLLWVRMLGGGRCCGLHDKRGREE